MLNTVSICGRLVKDCVLEQVTKDSVKTRFTLACERDFKDKEGNKPCDFLDCEVWNAGANFLEQYARKGDMLTASGALRKDTWKDKEGNWQSRVYIAVNAVQIVNQYEPKEKEPEKKSRRR